MTYSGLFRFAVCFGMAVLLASPAHRLAAEAPSPDRVDFVRDIQPILTARCVSCHGSDEQEGSLRLDARSIVLQGGVSGPALLPGEPEQSLLLRRVLGLDDQERMPLDDEPLAEREIALLRRWIAEGAAWPDAASAADAQIRPHWAYQPPRHAGLPQVKNVEWVRTPVDAFILARLEAEGLTPSPEVERSRLLRRVYLDLIGLPPSVEEVEAFLADDAPDAYERVVERLLASPAYGPRWARPWLDLARYADSNGYQADQYREVWPYRDWVIRAMNADMPFTQFTVEQLAGDLLPEATLEQKIATGFHRLTTCNVEAGVDPEENRVNQIIDRVNTTGMVWLGTSLECAQCHNHKYDPFTQKDYYRLFAYFNNTPLEVKGDGITYDFIGPMMDLPLAEEQKATRLELQSQRDAAQQELDAALSARAPAQAEWEQQAAANPAALPANIKRIVNLPPGKRNKKQQNDLTAYFVGLDPAIKALKERVAALQKQLDATQPPTTLVMIEDQPRQTQVLRRGEFLNPGEPVEPGVPLVLHDLPQDAPANRMALAHWLTDENNPLTARVVANRAWAEMFGQGIVATEEDFGSQGEPPTHPELLDWLAVEFMRSGWSQKHLHRLIVTSSVYRQSSRVTPELLERDPYNKLLARGPRLRLSAEMVRDNALAISGLLSEKQDGPPVYPPQPEGVWRHVGRNAPKWSTETDDDRFRRGVYVFWRRSAPYPSFVNFDAPDRAACVVQRARTNTPLQALTLLNDPAYLEMAAGLARRVLTERAADNAAQKLDYAFRCCVARAPTEQELRHLQDVHDRELSHFRANPQSAKTLLGKTPVEGFNAAEFATWLLIGNILLNLDETITKG
jgi:hypothetical protein